MARMLWDGFGSEKQISRPHRIMNQFNANQIIQHATSKTIRKQFRQNPLNKH